jgi:hypothetical protein
MPARQCPKPRKAVGGCVTDAEIFDALDVPEDRRVQLAALLHAWSRAHIPGPNLYAVMAVIYWNMLKSQVPWDVPEDTFDVSKWYDPARDGVLGTVRGWPWVGLND